MLDVPICLLLSSNRTSKDVWCLSRRIYLPSILLDMYQKTNNKEAFVLQQIYINACWLSQSWKNAFSPQIPFIEV